MMPCLYYIYVVPQKEETRGMENSQGWQYKTKCVSTEHYYGLEWTTNPW